MRKLILFGAILMSPLSMASDFDLKATMKQMKVEFKSAVEAQSLEEMDSALTNLSDLVALSKKGEYPPEKQAIYFEGFNKLSKAIERVETQLDNGNFDQAKESLREIDALRVEYHDKRNPSIWQRLFG
ncbi:cytochrome b562 [Vibrio sp. TRT 17S01]|uniref:cytochrome b562 n=1 Tax=Vibrio sp. TRT 17S01 TaxID=3418505 RepID=UPI003CF5A6EC